MENYITEVTQLALEYLPKLVMAIVVLILGLIIIKSLVKVFRKVLVKREVDASLVPFLSSMLDALLKVLLIISVASMVGIATTSFVAVLGAAGLAVGLALQGSLANFAGGVLILTLRPFKVGDVVEAQGFLGIINEIQIFNTIMKTFDNKTVILPNGSLANSPITNFSTEELRRCDMTFGISYDDDIMKAKQILTDLITADERVLNEPAAPFIALSELGDSAVNFVVRAWVKASDLWPVFFSMQEKVKMTFDKEGISIPYPQTDVHLYNETGK